MPASKHQSYLIGPDLLMGMCSQEPRAIAWADSVSVSHCHLSLLAIAIVESVIESGASDMSARKQWHKALGRVRGKFVVDGGSVVGVTDEVVQKWIEWRTVALQFGTAPHLQPVDQDVKLLLATADALDYTYVEYDSPYLRAAGQRGLKVLVI